MEQEKHKKAKEFWARHVKRWETSGTSRRQYCFSEGISYWAFRKHQKQINQGEGPENTLVSLPREIFDSCGNDATTIDLVVSETVTLRMRKGFDGELLRSILRELGIRL